MLIVSCYFINHPPSQINMMPLICPEKLEKEDKFGGKTGVGLLSNSISFGCNQMIV